MHNITYLFGIHNLEKISKNFQTQTIHDPDFSRVPARPSKGSDSLSIMATTDGGRSWRFGW